MKIIGTMSARNEDWCLGLTARAALLWLDDLVILNHASTDSTAAIAGAVALEHPGRVHIIGEEDPVWREMAHRQRMLDVAREHGATHICYIDADEVITGDLLTGDKPIRGLFNLIPSNNLLQIPWLALRGSIGQVHTSGPWSDGQNASFGFVDDPKLGWSSELRGGYDFHHRQPMGKFMAPWTPLGMMGPRRSGLMHLQFVSGKRLRAKQYLYQLTERLRWPDREPVDVVRKRYSLAVYGQTEPTTTPAPGLGPAPVAQWWSPYVELMRHFKPTAEPWQLAECAKIREAHPGIEQGLDDFGLFEKVPYNQSQ